MLPSYTLLQTRRREWEREREQHIQQHTSPYPQYISMLWNIKEHTGRRVRYVCIYDVSKKWMNTATTTKVLNKDGLYGVPPDKEEGNCDRNKGFESRKFQNIIIV